jgi:halogenation protein CepH
MGRPPANPDVVVVGGGPAGAVAATRLAQLGHTVVVLERDRFPRYHIGESLLSATLPIFDAIEATPRIAAHGFLEKPGGTFQWGRSDEPWSFFFREDPGGRPHAYQVVRAEFDEILLRNAADHGAEVHEEHRAVGLDVDGERPVVRAESASGGETRLEPRLVIDASGQQALLGRQRDLRRFNDFFKNLAIYGYWRGAERLPGALANHILSAAFPDGWFWYIPLHDGTMSVGAVVDVKRWREVAETEPIATYRKLVDACPAVGSRLAQAELVSEVRIVRDYSYDSSAFHGDTWLLAGDAACFIDPVFSTGVHLASLAGFLSARAASAVLRGEAAPGDAFAAYERSYRGAFERYLRFLMFFYDHNVDEQSYFWQARRVCEHAPGDLDARQAFVRLMSGGNDWDAIPEVAAREHARFETAIATGRAGQLPGADLLRVRTTERLLDKKG